MRPILPGQLRQRQKGEEEDEKQKGPTRKLKWLIAVEGESTLEIVVTSQKGGTVVKKLTIE